MTHWKTKEILCTHWWASSFFVFIFTLFTFSLTKEASAQEESNPIDAATQGKGGTGTTTISSWSIFSNQGTLGFYDHPTVSIHQENRFLVKELNVSAISATLPAKPGTIALGFSRFGYSLYNESQVKLGIGKRLWPSFAIGVGLGAHFLQLADGYGHSSAYTVEAGILYTPWKNLSVGTHLFNPTAQKIGTNPSKKLASGISAGLAYAAAPSATITIEVTEQENAVAQFHAGIQAEISDMFFLRAGYATNPDLLCFGLGYTYKPFTLDLALTTNNPLGISGFLTVAYIFN
jgi:hypothetical protein